jgi:phosphonopyruvate decarboxylase
MMGRIMLDLFHAVGLEYVVLEESIWEDQLVKARDYMRNTNRPYVIAIPRGLFDDFKVLQQGKNKAVLTREEALNIIVDNTSDDAVFISTTGKTSRELFEIREQRNDHHGKDFYTVGSMGCASSIAFGVGLADSQKKVYILDGDGAALMQLGTMATIGHYKNFRIKHILLDNNAHESTGSQPTVSNSVNFPQIASACGYEYVVSVESEEQLKEVLPQLENNGKLSLLVVKVMKGSRPDLGRPTTTPKENRDAFIRNFR